MPKGIPSFTLRKVSKVEAAAAAQKRPREYQKHGLTTLQNAVAKLGAAGHRWQ